MNFKYWDNLLKPVRGVITIYIPYHSATRIKFIIQEEEKILKQFQKIRNNTLEEVNEALKDSFNHWFTKGKFARITTNTL